MLVFGGLGGVGIFACSRSGALAFCSMLHRSVPLPTPDSHGANVHQHPMAAMLCEWLRPHASLVHGRQAWGQAPCCSLAGR